MLFFPPILGSGGGLVSLWKHSIDKIELVQSQVRDIA